MSGIKSSNIDIMKSMKKIYFIRHGESEGNAGISGQSASSPLTEKGRKQAEFVAGRCMKLPVDVIISSSSVRATETAQIIADITNKSTEICDLFTERKSPSEIVGRLNDDLERLRVLNTIKDNFALPGYRHSDEENTDDLKERAKEALSYLAAREEQNILVVAHGFFMRMIMAYVLFGDDLTARECDACARVFHLENTGITVLGYDEKSNPEMPWWLWMWNDHAHLG